MLQSNFIRSFVWPFLFILIASPLTAEQASDTANNQDEPSSEIDKTLEGHSFHGDVFNEGPRQKAYLMGGTGRVRFPISTEDPDVQKFFDQGLGQLYGFWYLEAERSFRHAASLDPECAMAYWGAAMANRQNLDRAKGFIEEAIARKGNADEREGMYIDALDAYVKFDNKEKDKRNDAFTKSLENILLKYPDDLEAKALLALHLWESKSSSTSYIAANALLDDIFEVEPMHSAHHFRIHLWDRRKPEMALGSAALCGQSSPSIAHMWHMPGHIYSRLHRYHDAAWQQEASARVDHAHMIRDRVMPDEIHNFAHNNEWLIRNLIHVGRVQDSVELGKNMIELPRHPRYNTLSKNGSTSFGRRRLFQVLRTYELWDDLIDLANSSYLEPTDDESEQIKRLRYLGLAYFQIGNMQGGNAQITELEHRLETLKAETVIVKESENEDTDEEEAKKLAAKARKEIQSKTKELETTINVLKGHEAIAKKDFQKGYELLKNASDVDSVYLATVQWQTGARDDAIKALRKIVDSQTNEVYPLAVLAEIMWLSGKEEECRSVFDELRQLSAQIDLDVPLFTRLAPIAKELGFETDWRIQRPATDDVGDRPPLDSLGPFRWHPSQAPNWELYDVEKIRHSSANFKGKPHVVIFYLGSGCLHCAEQLQAFAPRVADFEEAGLEMVAISTDDPTTLKQSIDNYDEVGLPIPLVSDEPLNVFKAFRVYDDFENQPLHGTFLIDGTGKVRWQDISYEPFMDPDFVLKEARRLLSQDDDPGVD